MPQIGFKVVDIHNIQVTGLGAVSGGKEGIIANGHPFEGLIIHLTSYAVAIE